MLKISNLSSCYSKVKVLNDVSLEVKEGQIIGLLGRNGAGKSTLLKSIMGLVEIVSGRISMDDEILTGKKAEEIPYSGIGYVPQGRRLFQELKVEENLKMGLLVGGNYDALDWVLSLFPVLKTRMKQKSGTLSGGEQQMVAIGRALMANPKMILLDEPSMGLAPQLVEEIFSIVKDLNKKELVSFLLAEQNTTVALKTADFGYILENGRVVMEGTAKELSSNEDVKEFYLGLSDKGRKSFKDTKHYRRRKRWLT